MTVEDLENLKAMIIREWATLEKPKSVIQSAPGVNDDEAAKTRLLWQGLQLGGYNVYSPELRVSMPLLFLPANFAFYHWPSFGSETISYIESVGFEYGALPAFDISLHGYRALVDNKNHYVAYARSIGFFRGEMLLNECYEVFTQFAILFD